MLARLVPRWASPTALAVFVAAFVVLYAVPLVVGIGAYGHNLMTLTFISVAGALAWNWVGGYVGQVSFGHASMFGIGGFLTARILLALPLPFWAAWLVGGLVAGVYALLWGHPTLRLRGPYFAIATIGVGEATRVVLTYWDEFTGGASGVSLPLTGVTQYALYWYGLYFMAAVVALSYYLRKSRIGLALSAIKADVAAAGDVGVNATYYQDLMLFLSGIVVGVAGGFYASYYSFIEPTDMFGFERSISYVLMAVIGGVGTILGPILGAVVFIVLQENLIATYPELYLGLYGILLVLIILFEPLGIAGLLIRAGRAVGLGSAGAAAKEAGDVGASTSASEQPTATESESESQERAPVGEGESR